MSDVTAAAAALDTAIAGFKSALTTYVHACATANTAYRIANAGRNHHRLECSAQHVFGHLVADQITAAVIQHDVGRPVPSLATIHAAD